MMVRLQALLKKSDHLLPTVAANGEHPIYNIY